MRKVTQVEIAEFERDLLFKQIANPHYRYGQAFLNYFSWVFTSMDEDGDLGHQQASRVWECNDRGRVLAMVDFYIEDTK